MTRALTMAWIIPEVPDCRHVVGGVPDRDREDALACAVVQPGQYDRARDDPDCESDERERSEAAVA
jgi:hypothetical protein